MFLWIHYQYDDSQEQAGEKEEEVWGLVGDGGAHVQEKENRCQMEGDDFPRVLSRPKLPGDDHLAKDKQSGFKYGEE